MVFSGSLLMSQATVQLNASVDHEADSFASLLEQDGNFMVDGQKVDIKPFTFLLLAGDSQMTTHDTLVQGSLLPSDDSYMFNLHADEQLRLWMSDTSRYSAHTAAHQLSNVSSRLGGAVQVECS
jgi:hypothetical protein